MKRVLLEALDMVFIPKQVGRQFVLAVALETSMVSVLLFGYVLCCVVGEFCIHGCDSSVLGVVNAKCLVKA